MGMPGIDDDELPQGDGLYHYTDAGGLYGILDSHSLWATHVSYMNDEKEFMFGIEAVIAEVREASKALPIPASDNKIADLLAKLIAPSVTVLAATKSLMARTSLIRDNYGPFVTCLSVAGDDLSQWRGYSGYGGYAVGFDAALLHESVKESSDGVRPVADERPYGPLMLGRRYFKKVLYQTDMAMIRAQLEEFIGQADKKHGDEDIQKKGLEWVYDLAVRTKHDAFKAEQEYRIATFDEATLFHPGNLGITPRVAIGFDPACVTEIVVGPGTDMDTRLCSIEFYLRRRSHYSHVKVVRSEAPYRNA